jgi:DNA-binding NtrC family response regulator
MPSHKIAIVEDDALLRQQIVLALSKDYATAEAGDRVEAEKMLSREKPDLVLLDLHLPPSGKSSEGLGLLERIKELEGNIIVIVMSADANKQATLKAIDSGAYDFFRKPFDFAELKLIIRRALEKQQMQKENERLRQELQSHYSYSNIVGESLAIRRVFDAVKRVADTGAAVIIRGESGTGKELIARAIHYNSRRGEHPFVGVNCAAMPETLVESELFGHERGAFTGAVATHLGRFEAAHQGTLFLDEIGAISPAVQAKLLRVLQDQTFERVGGTKQIRTDVRLITATNEDLEQKVKQGSFREDLYYRINVFPIQVPALRERKDDVPLLLDYFLRIYSERHGIALKRLTQQALEALSSYSWKGNVRELENLVQTLMLMSDGETIGLNELPSYISAHAAATISDSSLPPHMNLEEAVERYQRDLIQNAINKADGVKSKAAEILGIDKNQMKYLCRKLKI